MKEGDSSSKANGTVFSMDLLCPYHVSYDTELVILKEWFKKMKIFSPLP